jgi:integrase
MSRRNQGPRLGWLAKRNAYYIFWTERGRSRERSTGTADREKAEVAFAEWLRGRARTAGPRDPSEVLVTDILTDYATERGPKVVAGDRIAYAVEALAPFWEGNRVADVTRETCEAYAKHRSVKPAQGKRKERLLSAGTARRELGVLAAAINHAHREGRITRLVAVFLPERPESKGRWLTRKEAAALLWASRTPQARLYMPLFILIGLYTGRRKEAILSLRWPQVDLAAGLIAFDNPGRRRTKKQRGTVRIPARLLPHLRRARRRGTDLGYVVHADGHGIGDIKRAFAGACSRAGLTGVTPHTLRHTAATWLMQAGVDKWGAAGFLAMSLETLERTYGHHHPDYQREAADAIGRRPQIVRGIK